MAIFKFKNTKKQGDYGLAECIRYCAENGWTVLLPLTDSQEYDLAVDIDGTLKKVQCKTTAYKSRHGNYEVMLKTCGGNQSFHSIKKFKRNSVDFIYVLCDNKDAYWIETVSLEKEEYSSINLGHKYQKFKI